MLASVLPENHRCSHEAAVQSVKALSEKTGETIIHRLDYITHLPQELVMSIAAFLPFQDYEALRESCHSMRNCLISINDMKAELHNNTCNGTLKHTYEKWVDEKNIHNLISSLPESEAYALSRTQVREHRLFKDSVQLTAEYPALAIGERNDLGDMYCHFYDIFSQYEMELRRASPAAPFDPIFHFSAESHSAARDFYPDVICSNSIAFSDVNRLEDVVTFFSRAHDYWHSAVLKEQVFLSVAMLQLKAFWCQFPPGDHSTKKVEQALQPYSTLFARGRYALECLAANRPALT